MFLNYEKCRTSRLIHKWLNIGTLQITLDGSWCCGPPTFLYLLWPTVCVCVCAQSNALNCSGHRIKPTNVLCYLFIFWPLAVGYRYEFISHILISSIQHFQESSSNSVEFMYQCTMLCDPELFRLTFIKISMVNLSLLFLSPHLRSLFVPSLENDCDFSSSNFCCIKWLTDSISFSLFAEQWIGKMKRMWKLNSTLSHIYLIKNYIWSDQWIPIFHNFTKTKMIKY